MSNRVYYYQLHPFFNRDAKIWFDKIPSNIVNDYPELREVAAGNYPLWVAMIWLMHRSPEDRDEPYGFFNDIRGEINGYYHKTRKYTYIEIMDRLHGGGYPMNTSDNVGRRWDECDITWDGVYSKSNLNETEVVERIKSGRLANVWEISKVKYINLSHILWPIQMKGTQLFINWPLRPPHIGE